MALTTFDFSTLPGTHEYTVGTVRRNILQTSELDFNGDGFTDVLINMSFELGGGIGENYLGKQYVIYGSEDGIPDDFDVSNIDGSNGFIINNDVHEYDDKGLIYARSGDFNGDGKDDIFISSEKNEDHSGESYYGTLIYGTNDLEKSEILFSELNDYEHFNLSEGGSFDNRDFIFTDIDNDGYDDLVLGRTSYMDPGSSLINDAFDSRGMVQIIYGSETPFTKDFYLGDKLTTHETTHITNYGDNSIDEIGNFLSVIGDINNDGYQDIKLQADNIQETETAYILFMSDHLKGSDIELKNIRSKNGFAVEAGDNKIKDIQGVGDINDDGIDDFGVIASDNSLTVFYGTSDGFPDILDTSSLTATEGFSVMQDVLYAGMVGDINADGIDDFYVQDSTFTHIIFGKKEGFSSALDLTALTASEGIKISNLPETGTRTNGQFHAVGDISGDGLDDIAIYYRGSTKISYITDFGFDRALPEEPEEPTGEVEETPGISGKNLVKGGTDNDTLRGGFDNDTLYGNQGADHIQGAKGDDMLYGNKGNDTLRGGDGADKIWGGAQNDLILGLNGNDSLYGMGHQDELRGGEGDDVLRGNKGADVLKGGAGADKVFGGAQNDTLIGGDGNDTLEGGGEDDVLTGGAGADLFHFRTGSATDRITDFEDGSDMIEIKGQSFDDLTITQMGENTEITFEDSTIILEGQVAGTITADDFLF